MLEEYQARIVESKQQASDSDSQDEAPPVVTDSDAPVKLLSDFAHLLKQQRTFFMKVKRGSEQTDIVDSKISYFNECLKNQVLCFPYLNKVQDSVLVLKDIALSEGICQAIRSVLTHIPTLIHHAVLDHNSMSSTQTSLLLDGFLAQSGAFKTLTIQDNDLDLNCVAQLTQLTKRRLPEHLDALCLLDCRIAWQNTEKLVKDLNPNFLRTLSLVNVNLNEFSLDAVYSLVQKNKRLVNLDISANHLAPRQMRSFIESVSKNRRLQ